MTHEHDRDIISDLTSAPVGGADSAPSANIGNAVAIFEAAHGSAPKYAGTSVINPTAVVPSAVMMLRHFGDFGASSSAFTDTVIANSVARRSATRAERTSRSGSRKSIGRLTS